MKKTKKLLNYFSKTELLLWGISTALIITAFCIFDRESYLTLAASLLGVTSLIFNAKGNPIGQAIIIVFSVMYGIISYSFAYYGEMLTYLGMTVPMATIALVAWLRNPSDKGRGEVKISRLRKNEPLLIAVLTAIVTIAFYFILKELNTANIIPSTISVTTSFVAAYLTFRRSPTFALAYAANDIVLIVLWVMASVADISYISVVICFACFLANDMYCYVNWRKMRRMQAECAQKNAPTDSRGVSDEL